LNLAVTLAQSSTGSTISLSLDFLGAAQAKVRSETQVFFPKSLRFPLGNLFLLAPNTICKKNINCLSTFELNTYKVIIIFVIIKPLHAKLAHALVTG